MFRVSACTDRADFVDVNARLLAGSSHCHKSKLANVDDPTSLELSSCTNTNCSPTSSIRASTRPQPYSARRKYAKRRARVSRLVSSPRAIAGQTCPVRLWLVWIAALSSGLTIAKDQKFMTDVTEQALKRAHVERHVQKTSSRVTLVLCPSMLGSFNDRRFH